MVRHGETERDRVRQRETDTETGRDKERHIKRQSQRVSFKYL